MAEPVRAQADLSFVKELQAVGGESLKKCYQCATCSVACPISPQANPYPRKEMVWAQWGLKDRLLNDADIWLCHNCGTCSDLCPRGAKPADLLAALRNMAYRSMVGPKFIGDALTSAKGLPLLAGIPALIYAIIWFIRAGQLGTFFPVTDDGHVVYGLLFPGDYTIDPIFTAAAIFVAYTFYSGAKKLIASIKPEGETMMLGKNRPSLFTAFKETIVEILAHSKWTECGDGKVLRKIGHQTLVFGFIALAIVTSVIAVSHWGGNFLYWGTGHHNEALGYFGHTPLDQTNPVKILANIGAILLLVGLALLTKMRNDRAPEKFANSFYDWYLLGVIWVIALTGVFSQLLRLAEIKYLAYPMYYFHLIAVFMLIAYLPWTKLGHLVYRTTALTYTRYMGRKPV